MMEVRQISPEAVSFKEIRQTDVCKAFQAAHGGNNKQLKELYRSFPFNTPEGDQLRQGYFVYQGWYFGFKAACKRYNVHFGKNDGGMHHVFSAYALTKVCVEHTTRGLGAATIELVEGNRAETITAPQKKVLEALLATRKELRQATNKTQYSQINHRLHHLIGRAKATNIPDSVLTQVLDEEDVYLDILDILDKHGINVKAS